MLRVLAKDRDGRERSGSYNPAAPLGRGAFGAVYRDESLPGRVFKIYHGIVDPETLNPGAEQLDQQRRRELERKATAMLATAPEGGTRPARPTIAWPLECVYLADGRFVGLAMDEIVEALPLDFVLTDALRAQRGLPAAYDYALSIGESLATVVDQLHRSGHAVVDLTPMNVRVYRDEPQAALTGADKYRVNGGHTVYPARFLTNSIAAPELQKSAGARPDLAGEYQDRFALAFLIFQLLNGGATPFDVTGRDGFEPPAELNRRILDRLYPFGLKPHAHVAPPSDSVHEYWPQHLREMFDAAFSAPNGADRPAPARWAETLRILREQAKTCAVKPRAHGKARLEARDGPCILCVRDQKLGRGPAQAASGTPQAAAIGAVRAAQAALKDARLPNLTIERLRVFGAAAALAAVAAFLLLRPNQESPSPAADGGFVVVAKGDSASPGPIAPTAPETAVAEPEPPLAEPPLAEPPIPAATAASPDGAASQVFSVAPSSIERPTLRGYMRYAPRAASYTLAFNVDVNGKARDVVVERGAPQGYGFEEEARRLVAGALFKNTPRGARAPYRARMRLNFPFDSSPSNAYAPRRSAGAGAQPALTQEMAKLSGALVRVGFVLGADGRARNVTVTGRDANAEANAAVYESEARNFVSASSFETPPDMPAAGLRSTYMVEFPAGTPAPAATQTAASPAQRNWRWLRRPTGEDLNREFPDRAISARRSGDVVLACLVLEEGALNCAVVSESPNGYRFGPAALRVLREARVSPTLSNGQSAVGAQITVPIRFEYRESPRAPSSGP